MENTAFHETSSPLSVGLGFGSESGDFFATLVCPFEKTKAAKESPHSKLLT
jgi:hypothetical protein